MQAARANDAARAKSFAVLSAAESRFTLIGRALRKACKAKAPAVLADFPSVALNEAAAAFLHQQSGLNILHASARIHTGKQQGVVTAFLGERFDEQGADLINDGVFTLELDPFQLAVGCYPVLQIALYIYLAGHLPLAVTVAPIVEAAKGVKLMKGATFNPADGVAAFFVIHAQASRDSQIYDATAVYGHLVRAVDAAAGVQYEFFPVDSDEPVSWRVWANKVTREHQRRISDGAAHAIYTPDDVDILRNGLRRFAEAFVREERARAVGTTFGTSNHVVDVGGLLSESDQKDMADVKRCLSPVHQDQGLGFDGGRCPSPARSRHTTRGVRVWSTACATAGGGARHRHGLGR